MLDDINVDSLIMDSIQNDEPASATKEELEELIDERQQTLAEWYERSLIDTSTFDHESREKIQTVMDQSEDVYGSEADLREFFERGISVLGGDVEKAGDNLFRAELPDSLRRSSDDEPYGPFTFNREFAMDHDGIEYISPDAELVQELMQRVLDGEQGTLGLKLLPFIDNPGITYNYRVKFEDGTGEVIREELIPVFVDVEQQDPQQRLGQRVIEGDSVKGSPNGERTQVLLEQQDEMQSSADRYISRRVESRRDELQERRHKETQQELDDLETYAEAERERIESLSPTTNARPRQVPTWTSPSGDNESGSRSSKTGSKTSAGTPAEKPGDIGSSRSRKRLLGAFRLISRRVAVCELIVESSSRMMADVCFVNETKPVPPTPLDSDRVIVRNDVTACPFSRRTLRGNAGL